MREHNRFGGGAQTNANGLQFERDTSLAQALLRVGYAVEGEKVKWQGREIAVNSPKHGLYSKILEPRGVDWRTRISKQLLPDEAFLNLQNHTLYILEKKFQGQPGSVDEKLQTCDFKKKQYQKLIRGTDIQQVEYCYLLCDFFKASMYRDVLEYIVSVGCKYRFNELPIEMLGLSDVTGA